MESFEAQATGLSSAYGGAEEKLLDRYLAEIRHTKILTREQEVRLGREMARAESELREALVASRQCWLYLLDHWQAVRKAGLLTSTLTQPRTEAGGDDAAMGRSKVGLLQSATKARPKT